MLTAAWQAVKRVDVAALLKKQTHDEKEEKEKEKEKELRYPCSQIRPIDTLPLSTVNLIHDPVLTSSSTLNIGL